MSLRQTSNGACARSPRARSGVEQQSVTRWRYRQTICPEPPRTAAAPVLRRRSAFLQSCATSPAACRRELDWLPHSDQPGACSALVGDLKTAASSSTRSLAASSFSLTWYDS